ncbi:TPA: hypothetical protein HA338_06705 [Methanosarcina acetivorans]|uniref:Uncharacterized protein n=1 Tax=Methanosarcina acetivorans TaxID=2214 RepID=A0A832S7W6_9EURY|nr:hypothetical protein [Methanosarcina acetivorans]HIH93731.1 hypothetical protein [Methanosarcina acetivorans]
MKNYEKIGAGFLRIEKNRSRINQKLRKDPRDMKRAETLEIALKNRILKRGMRGLTVSLVKTN